MADAYASDEKPKTGKTKKPLSDDEKAALCKQAVERYAKWVEKEGKNVDEAYEDLSFKAGRQWTKEALGLRKDRPTLTINRIPQFIRQVTGDMRQMRPSIKAVPVDSRGDRDTAETIAGMIRYIENRSDAAAIYMAGADSQVSCGIGHWKVKTEYAAGTTFNQELRIIGVDDQVAVACDPDAKEPMKDDAQWWIIPTDISRESFKEKYPDALVEDFDDAKIASAQGWFDQDFVRIAEYWVKKPMKRVLALMPDGGVADLTDKDEAEREEVGKTAKRVETRESYKICRYLITACHILEETDWPGMIIPIVPAIGEEIKINKETVRHGLTRFARDPQRMINYYSSAEAEVVGLQPKSPWLATDKNIEKNESMWATANTEAHSALIFTPDSRNGGAPPQRVQPAVSSQGITEGLDRAVNDMKGVIGIYDAGLGNKSNETSGKAIIARQREGDVGTFVYIDNWSRSIRRTGSILIDLIPHVYDTERMIRIMGDDGKVDLKWINKPTGEQVLDPATGQPTQEAKIENDVTIGAYDVVLETGPSYSTKREEAKESMKEFIQSAPDTAPIIMDLLAKAQDWPLADEISKRFEAMAPPPIQQLLAKQKQETGDEEQPDPQQMQAQQAAQMQQQAQQAMLQLELENKQLENDKLRAEIGDILNGDGKNPPVNPLETVKAQLELRKLELELEHTAFQQENERRMAEQQMQQAGMQEQQAGVEQQAKRADAEFEFQHKRRMGELDFHHKRAETVRAMKEAKMNSSGPDGELPEYEGDVKADKRHTEIMQGFEQMAKAFQAGMEAIANVMAQPKQISVSRDARGQVIGAQSQPARVTH